MSTSRSGARSRCATLVAQGVNPERIRLVPPSTPREPADDEARRVDIAVGK
jgi:hypothetical protein